MNIEKKVAISLYEIKKMIENDQSEDALEAVDRLRKVMGRLGRNNEALGCGVALHGVKVIHKAKIENRILLGSDQMLHEIFLIN